MKSVNIFNKKKNTSEKIENKLKVKYYVFKIKQKKKKKLQFVFYKLISIKDVY